MTGASAAPPSVKAAARPAAAGLKRAAAQEIAPRYAQGSRIAPPLQNPLSVVPGGVKANEFRTVDIPPSEIRDPDPTQAADKLRQ